MFELHPRLKADTIAVTDWPLCRILLMNDSAWPWLVLVPRRPDMREIHDLGRDDRQILMDEIAAASQGLQRFTGADKMNVAALGNVVAQLHVHVIARFTTDPAWPRPVFGVQPAIAYDADAQARLTGELRLALKQP